MDKDDALIIIGNYNLNPGINIPRHVTKMDLSLLSSNKYGVPISHVQLFLTADSDVELVWMECYTPWFVFSHVALS